MERCFHAIISTSSDPTCNSIHTTNTIDHKKEIEMAANTGSRSVATVDILLVALFLLSGGGEMEAVLGLMLPATGYIPARSLLGSTCFMEAFKKCMDSRENIDKGKSAGFCLEVATYYCDIGHLPEMEKAHTVGRGRARIMALGEKAQFNEPEKAFNGVPFHG